MWPLRPTPGNVIRVTMISLRTIFFVAEKFASMRGGIRIGRRIDEVVVCKIRPDLVAAGAEN